MWASEGHNVEIWTRRLDASHPRMESEGRAVVRRLGWTTPVASGSARWIEKFCFALSLLARLIRCRLEYDMVMVHQSLYPALITTFAKRVTGRPLVLRNASTGTTSDFLAWGRSTEAVLGALRSAADALVVTNREGLREALARGFEARKVHRIPNGVAPGQAESPRPLGRPTRFAYIGGLRPEKRVDLLLRSWAQAGAPGELRLAGEGACRPALEALARDLAITPVFLGNVSEPRSLLRDTDVFVLPSDAEGMSNALLDAMASGCACIATYVGGNVDCLGSEGNPIPQAGQILKGVAGWLVGCKS